MEMDEKRHETNENYKQVIEKAKREEADNKKVSTRDDYLANLHNINKYLFFSFVIRSVNFAM
jgi:hypothetical protein